MFPVLDIDQNDIVDTNGAGDAFVGGTARISSTQLDFCVHSQLTFDTSQLCTVVMSPDYMSVTFSLLFSLRMSLSSLRVKQSSRGSCWGWNSIVPFCRDH